MILVQMSSLKDTGDTSVKKLSAQIEVVGFVKPRNSLTSSNLFFQHLSFVSISVGLPVMV